MRTRIMLVAAAAFGLACDGSYDRTAGITPPPPPPPGDTTVATVSIVDNSFNPAGVSVRVGRAVRWTNNGAVAHTVTANDSSFVSGSIAPSGTFQRTFAGQGTFPYFCTLHGEAGTVSVTP